MMNEKFFRMLDGIEDKYIEEASRTLALQQEEREGVVVHAAPKSRKSIWKTVAVSAAATAAVVFGAVFLMRNVGKNGLMLEPANSFDSSVQDGEIVSGNSELVNSENSSVQSEESAPPTESSSTSSEAEDSTSSAAEESSVPTESDGEDVTSGESDVSEPNEVAVTPSEIDILDLGTVYKVVDPVDDHVIREVDFSDGKITVRRNGYNVLEDYEYDPQVEGSVASLGYLKDFFGTDALPFDERYKGNLERIAFNARYDCKVSEGAKAYTPVNGKVVAVNDPGYNNGWGQAVAIEFEDKVFAIAHLAEVNVKVGDTVTAGQTVGICGMSGSVYVGDGPTFSMIAMVKVADPDF